MKQSIYLIFMLISLSGFSQGQEKKGICSSGISLYHANGNDFDSSNRFSISGFYTNQVYEIRNFTIDSTTWTDSVIYELLLPFGDSLNYSASWHADGQCNYLDSADVNSLVTILEGTPFPIAHKGDYSIGFYYDLQQIGYVTEPCLFKIKRRDSPYKYFFRVKFKDEPKPLIVPQIVNDINLWMSAENTLAVKAVPGCSWKLEVYALSGELIRSNTLEGSQTLDVSSFPKGYYVAHIKDNIGNEKHIKFVK